MRKKLENQWIGSIEVLWAIMTIYATQIVLTVDVGRPGKSYGLKESSKFLTSHSGRTSFCHPPSSSSLGLVIRMRLPVTSLLVAEKTIVTATLQIITMVLAMNKTNCTTQPSSLAGCTDKIHERFGKAIHDLPTLLTSTTEGRAVFHCFAQKIR